MLQGAPALAPDEMIGVIPPRMGRATVSDVAVSAVMAGCLPAHFPIVVAAVRADVRSGVRARRGPGHHAQRRRAHDRQRPGAAVATRARHGDRRARPRSSSQRDDRPARCACVLINAGGALPGAADMSTLGQPAKFTCCVGEAEEDSPWPPYAQSNGVSRRAQSAVTAIAVEGPSQIMFVPIGDSAPSRRRPPRRARCSHRSPCPARWLRWAIRARRPWRCARCTRTSLLPRRSIERRSAPPCSSRPYIAPARSAGCTDSSAAKTEPFDDDDLVPVLASPDHLDRLRCGWCGHLLCSVLRPVQRRRRRRHYHHRVRQ